MPINDPYAPAFSRPPRLRLLAGSQIIGGPLNAEVASTTHYRADTFEAQLAIGGDPTTGLAFWGSQTSLDVTIQASLDGGQSWKTMIMGQVDTIEVSMEHGVCAVRGRDLSARLIDARTQESFQNQTASQVAEKLAERHGLTPDVQSTSTLVGRYYSQDHAHVTGSQFSRTRTEWDVLVYLAQHEQFDVWVTGSTLHFKPGVKPGGDPWLAVWTESPHKANVMTLGLSRSLTLAPDVVVKVRSWNSRHAKGFTKSSPSNLSATSAVSSGRAQQYIYVFPNLTEDEAQKKANSLREDITRHERLVDFSAPADLLLTTEVMVQLQGTGSSWDQTYYVDRVVRRMSFEEGFVMDVRCKNHSPQSDATA